MFRKRRVATPGFGHTPWNPIHGDQANLRQDGTAPFCAMMQVAAADTYANYVICRGFDTRILKFIDYAEGNPDKPGIAVAKPFGKRIVGTYEIGEVYPALLPTQGNAEFQDFRQVTFTPPSPATVNWRVGQNPGVVSGGLEGGQPASLSDTIQVLYDHNGKVVNWLLIDNASNGGGCERIRFNIVEVVCEEAALQYVNVDWTHYTGDCGQEPPGVDPITGYIKVYDDCIMSYFTVAFLTAGDGAEGSATYWRTRGSGYGDDCEGLWIVDHICGQPECS